MSAVAFHPKTSLRCVTSHCVELYYVWLSCVMLWYHTFWCCCVMLLHCTMFGYVKLCCFALWQRVMLCCYITLHCVMFIFCYFTLIWNVTFFINVPYPLSQGNRWRAVWRYCSQRILQWSWRQVGNTHPSLHRHFSYFSVVLQCRGRNSFSSSVFLSSSFLLLLHWSVRRWCCNSFTFCPINTRCSALHLHLCDPDWSEAHTWPLTSVSLNSHCIQQILEAVLHCHQMGVVHRDLKVRFMFVGLLIVIKSFMFRLRPTLCVSLSATDSSPDSLKTPHRYVLSL